MSMECCMIDCKDILRLHLMSNEASSEISLSPCRWINYESIGKSLFCSLKIINYEYHNSLFSWMLLENGYWLVERKDDVWQERTTALFKDKQVIRALDSVGVEKFIKLGKTSILFHLMIWWLFCHHQHR